MAFRLSIAPEKYFSILKFFVDKIENIQYNCYKQKIWGWFRCGEERGLSEQMKELNG